MLYFDSSACQTQVEAIVALRGLCIPGVIDVNSAKPLATTTVWTWRV